MRPPRTGRIAVGTLRLTAWALVLHTAVNARLLRVPPLAAVVDEHVAVLLPVRDEEHRLEPTLRSLLAQTHLPHLSLLVLDDGSTDGTAALVRRVASADARLQLLTGSPPPVGWLGKPWACHQLASTAPPEASVLVFIDADVVLVPDALARTIGLLRSAGLTFVSPYPRQLAGSLAERLVQPLLQWSWLALLPLRLAETSPCLSTAVANGQLLAVDRAAYDHAGGHAAAPGAVLEDIALARTLRQSGGRAAGQSGGRVGGRSGGRGGMADGTDLATCRMYDGWGELRDGYTKSLWAAGGSPAASVLQVGLLGALWLRPDPVTLAAGAASRALAARRTGSPVLPDALAHPASVGVWAGLTALSWWRHHRGTLRWKGRTIR